MGSCVFKSRRSGSDARAHLRGERETRPSWCEALAAPGAAVCWGLLPSTVEHGLGRRGSTAPCQSRFAWPSRSSLLLLLPAPSNALKSHFQARHRINLWALHIAGSAKQDVGSFFLSLCVLADFFTSRRIWKGREIPPAPPRLGAVQFFSTLITLLWLHPNRFHMLTQLTSVPNYFTCDLVYFLRKSARYLLRTNKINLSMSF